MVQVTDNSIIYSGNGVTTKFPYAFQIIDPTDIKVYIVNPEGVETLITSDYYVDTNQQAVYYPGYAPGAVEPGSETPPVLPTGWKIILYRQVPIDQQSVLDDHWPFKEIEHMVDKSRIIEQQLAGDLKRALKISLQFPNLDITIPVGVNKSFRWNSDGTNLELTEDPALVLPLANQALAATVAARDALLLRPGYLAVEGDLTNIDAVADNLVNITTVVDNLEDITAVAGDLTNIDAVANDLAAIDSVADKLTDIDTVVTNLTDISTVSTNISNINAVADDLTKIDGVYDNLTNIDNVWGIRTNIATVAGSISAVNAVATDISAVQIVSTNITDVGTVAGISSDVSAVAGISGNVTTVAGMQSNIAAVVANATNINTVAGDILSIVAVANDLANIDAASNNAALSKQYAIGVPTEPPEGSAKYWAGQAAGGQVNTDWNETDSTKKSYLKNHPSKETWTFSLVGGGTLTKTIVTEETEEAEE